MLYQLERGKSMKTLKMSTVSTALVGLMMAILLGFSGQVHADQDGDFTSTP